MIDASLRTEEKIAGRRRRAWPKGRRALAWAGVLTAVAIGVALLAGSDRIPPAASAARSVEALPVGVAVAETMDFDVTLPALGTVTPLATVAIKSQISGRVTQIGFQEGQMVKEGDFLVEIDPRPYRHALRQAQGQLARDKALLDNARLDHERYKRLVAQNSVSRQQLDTQASLVRQYEGTVEIDEGNVENAALNLEYCRIRAPVAGRVGLRQVDLGNYVQAGGDPLVTLTELQPITVVFPVAEDHLPQLMKALSSGGEQPVVVLDRAGRRELARGTLTSLDSQIDPTTGTVKFKAQFDNGDLGLFPNQFVNVRLLAETLRGATVIPTSGVQYGQKGPFAYIVSADDTAHARPITPGPAEGERTTVLAGVKAGERLVVAGADRLRDGAKVRAVGE
jgi:multidrug efflux system membrane fusion protein